MISLGILQFFLGDYRPLIHDLYGNVLDQVNGSSFTLLVILLEKLNKIIFLISAILLVIGIV